MKRDTILTQPLISSFLSCEKDQAAILRKLFVESQPFSDDLKRLLVVQNADCLSNKTAYDMSTYPLSKLLEDQYIVITPKIELPEHDQIKAFVVLSFDDFTPNDTNPLYRDCMIQFDIVCHHDAWNLQNYQQRPYKIMGIIDGLLNRARLSGIGETNFFGAGYKLLNEDWSFYTMSYRAIHSGDDIELVPRT